MADVFGFGSYAPGIIQYFASSCKYRAQVINSAADAALFDAEQSELPKLYLWSDLAVFARCDYTKLQAAAHLFFGDRSQLLDAHVTLLDPAQPQGIQFKSIVPTLRKVLRQLGRNGDLPEDFLAYVRARPAYPESLFSREVRKTTGKKKKDTDPAFVVGSSLRQGIKDILDLCGHNREVLAYQFILRYIAFLSSAPVGVRVQSYSTNEIKAHHRSPEWVAAETSCYEAVRDDLIIFLSKLPSVPPHANDMPLPSRVSAALDLIREWHISPFSVGVVAAYLMCLKQGMPEGRAVYEASCDPSCLNLVCRNMDLVRPNIKAFDSFYRRTI